MRNTTHGMLTGRMDVFFSGQRWSLRIGLYPRSLESLDISLPPQRATGIAIDSTRNVRMLRKPKA